MDPTAGLVVVLKAAREDVVTSDPYYCALTGAGLQPCLIPVLSFDFFNMNLLWEAVKAHEKYSGIVFTSPRAVEGVLLAATENCGVWKCASSDCPHSWWGQKKVFVVGEATAAAVEEMLGLPSQGQEAGNAHTLSHLILDALTPGGRPLLFPCGNLKRETLPRKLQDGGVFVEAITVYQTRAHTQLKGHLEMLRDKEFVAVGPSTAEAIEKAGLKVWGVLVSPTPKSLVETITQKSHQHEEH